MIKPGQVSHALVSSLDFVPTFAALAGVALPSDRVYDGMDITNVLLHGATTAHETLFHPHDHGTGYNSTCILSCDMLECSSFPCGALRATLLLVSTVPFVCGFADIVMNPPPAGVPAMRLGSLKVY